MKYMKNCSLRLGYAPTRRFMYDAQYAYNNRDMIRKKVEELMGPDVELVTIDAINEEGLLANVDDAVKAAAYFQEQHVDALFIPHTNFGTEEAAAGIARRLQVPTLLWGPRDPAPLGEGVRQNDTQCGMFATSKALLRWGVKFTYIENCEIESPIFAKGFCDFLSAALVVKTVKNLRMGILGQRPKPFLSVIYNEGELAEKFGIDVVPIGIEEVIGRAKEILAGDRSAAKEIYDDIHTKVNCAPTPDESVWKMAAVETAILEAAARQNISVLSAECWTAFPGSELHVPLCFVIADLTDRGLPTSCETDTMGAVTAAMATSAKWGNDPTFFADLTLRHPTNDNAELLWHCGPFPPSLAKDPATAKLGGDVNPQRDTCKGFYCLKDGDVSILRCDSVGGEYSMFIGQGKTCEGPVTNGTYVWVEVGDWPTWERALMEGPYIHHVVGIYGHIADILKDACKYLGIKAELYN